MMFVLFGAERQISGVYWEDELLPEQTWTSFPVTVKLSGFLNLSVKRWSLDQEVNASYIWNQSQFTVSLDSKIQYFIATQLSCMEFASSCPRWDKNHSVTHNKT